MEEILSDALGPLSWALSTADGFIRKINNVAASQPRTARYCVFRALFGSGDQSVYILSCIVSSAVRDDFVR